MILYENFIKVLNEEISDEKTLEELSEVESLPRIMSDSESPNISNKIVRPQGIVVQDTWNNFIFPIQPKPRIDTSKLDITEVYKRFRELYVDFPTMFLPWHYVVEMIGNRYYVFQTRPIDTKFPLSNKDVLEYNHNFINDEVKTFFINNQYQIENMIHVCIIGDTNLDVYTNKVYKLISRSCVQPMFRDMRITGSVDTRVLGFNIGLKFDIDMIRKFGKR